MTSIDDIKQGDAPIRLYCGFCEKEIVNYQKAVVYHPKCWDEVMEDHTEMIKEQVLKQPEDYDDDDRRVAEIIINDDDEDNDNNKDDK